MPTVFTHGFAAFSIGKILYRNLSSKIFATGIICSMIPDADVIGFRLGIPYESMFGHRGFTHSFTFALIWCSFVMLTIFTSEKIFSRQWWIFFLFFFMSTVSHPILDACTNGGLGVALFAPFSNHRYFFPLHPIKVSPLNAESFLRQRGLVVLWSEFRYVWIPCLMLLLISFLNQKKQK